MYNNKGKNECEIKDGNCYIEEYTDNDKLLFEGENLNGLRNGKGKEYDSNEIIKI